MALKTFNSIILKSRLNSVSNCLHDARKYVMHFDDISSGDLSDLDKVIDDFDVFCRNITEKLKK